MDIFRGSKLGSWLLGAVVVLSLSRPAAGADGNALLRDSVRLHPTPGTYTVPMHFHAHFQRPFGFSPDASAVLYFAAPNHQALVITSLPRIISKTLARSYGNIDTIPANWSKEYRITNAAPTAFGGDPAYRLDAVPMRNGDITHAAFYLLRRDLSAVGAEWFWRDGSQVRLLVRNRRVGKYLLPAHEELSVVMPRFALTAQGESGIYTIDTPVPQKVFATLFTLEEQHACCI